MAAAQPNLGLYSGFVDLEDNWGDEMNAALRVLDWAVMPRVLDRDLATPPGSPANGDAYIVAASPTGAWSGLATRLVRWSAQTGAWDAVTAKRGWEVWVEDEGARVRFDGSAWAAIGISAISGLQAALDAKASSLAAVNNQSGTSYTLAAADAASVVRCSNTSPITATLPLNATTAIPVGTVISVRQIASGPVTISPAVGVTLNVPAGRLAVTRAIGAVAMVHKVATDTWDLTGDLQAA